ncbi:hypothetical protein IG631_23574 [Alternaria alternata]|nr:hypothetical protein IG631_23574 [Alternaria alternata]
MDQRGEWKPRCGIGARMEAAGFSWRQCCLPSVQGQRRVYKEPVSPASILQPSHLFLAPPQHGHLVTFIVTGNVMSIEVSISQRPQSWTDYTEDRKHNARKVIDLRKKNIETQERLIEVEEEKLQLRKANLKLEKEKLKLEKKNLENEEILDDNESRQAMVLVKILEQKLGDVGAQ